MKSYIFTFCSIVLFLLPSTLLAAELKVRAREHFDTVQLEFGEESIEVETSGIGPTINIWWEEPYRYAFGFAVGMMFIHNDAIPEVAAVDEKMELWKTGIEWKYWFSQDQGGLFSRLGVSENRLKTKGDYGELKSTGTYWGLGWEFKFSKIGLAIEAAQRQIKFDHEISVTTFSPSIGVHFYGYL